MIKFAVIIVAILFISFLIDVLLSNSVGKRYRIFVAPGIILHELSHAIFCFLTGAPVSSINMFKKEGGEVKHGRSKIPILGPILIGVAPFIVGSLAIYFIAKLIGIDDINISTFPLTQNNIIFWAKTILGELDISSYGTWVGVYLLLSVAVTMTPSMQDVKNMILALIAVFIIVYVIYKYTAWRPDISVIFTDQLLIILSSILIILIFSLFLSIIIFAISRIFQN